MKNMRLSVNIRDKSIHISAPIRMNLENIRDFAIQRLDWIKKQLAKIAHKKPERELSYISGEEHTYLGKSYTLNIQEIDSKQSVIFDENSILVQIKAGSTQKQKQILLESRYRQELRILILGLIPKWEDTLGVKVKESGIKKMKTRWGTCNTRAARIWLNLELVHFPIDCLEYVVVHEMVHLLERGHGKKFITHMNKFLPEWKKQKKILNDIGLSGKKS